MHIGSGSFDDAVTPSHAWSMARWDGSCGLPFCLPFPVFVIVDTAGRQWTCPEKRSKGWRWVTLLSAFLYLELLLLLLASA